MMRRSRLVLAVFALRAVVAAATLVALDINSMTRASHTPGAISLLAIDMNTAGNTVDAPTDSTGNTTADQEETSLGTIENCPQITGPGTLDTDGVGADWPANGDQLIGYDLILNFNPAVVRVTATNLGIAPGFLPLTLLSADPQTGASGSYGVVESSKPNATGAHSMGVIDLGGPYGDAVGSGGNGNLGIDGVEEETDGEEASPGFQAPLPPPGGAAA